MRDLIFFHLSPVFSSFPPTFSFLQPHLFLSSFHLLNLSKFYLIKHDKKYFDKKEIDNTKSIYNKIDTMNSMPNVKSAEDLDDEEEEDDNEEKDEQHDDEDEKEEDVL